MGEEDMIALAQAALDDHGIHDHIISVGQFAPRGRSAAWIGGGTLGDELGSFGGTVGEAIGGAIGMIGGAAAVGKAQGLPQMFHVAVSEHTVYGMRTKSRRREPDTIIFQLPRDTLRAVVHQRGMVRVLELINTETGAKVELEGSRLPITHSKDVMDVLTGDTSEKP